MNTRRLVVCRIAGIAAATFAALFTGGADRPDRFHHAKHARLFPDCTVCHAGAAIPDAPMWPAAQSCRTCHDGAVRPALEWSAPLPIQGPVRFDHGAHAARLREQAVAPAQCQDCHSPQGGERMQVHRAVSSRCFECHEGREHLAAESECITCHAPLSESTFLTAEQVARFPRPPSHDVAGFALGGHGELACPGQGGGKKSANAAAACAVCHAQQFCETCHVDAASNECITSLGSNPHSRLHAAKSRTPATHASASFAMTHGHGLSETDAQCGTCHTQSSCRVCHAATPGVAAMLRASTAPAGVGAQVVRKKPSTHHADFRDAHGAMASADPASCAACHHRAQCLDCHRTDPAAESGYHPPGFLARHPVAAYARETSCADCHNPGSFCQTCHEGAGLTASSAILGAGFHDAKDAFVLGHGPAARRSLESCVSCHTESDCLVCHSSQGGRRFNPHGPDFDAARLADKAPQMCTVCHGAAIPK